VRKIILQMMITLDGYIAGPNDEMDWIDNDGDGRGPFRSRRER
jgi:hypothetical protein